MKIVVITWLVAISFACNAEESYRIPGGIGENERGEYAPKSHYKILGIEISNSTLKSIKKMVGDATVYEGSHTADHLCYITKKQKIEFTISSLGFGYEVERIGNEDTSRCKHIQSSLKSGAGLKVGLEKSTVLELLGKPSKKSENSASYIYWVQEKPGKEIEERLRAAHEIPDSQGLWLDVYTGIRILYINNVVEKFSVHTTETY